MGGSNSLQHLLDVKDSVGRVGSRLLFGSVTNEALLIGVSDIRRGDTVSLVVDENLNLALLHDTNARVGGAQILKEKQESVCSSGQGGQLVREGRQQPCGD